ncbi:MAG: hypothetical protein ABL998_16320 [Planctomycetota bacterium]
MLARRIAIASLAFLQGTPAPALPIQGFAYRSGALTPGRTWHYRKSNLDGSNASEIALHVASETRLEALKFHAGVPEATLVVAEMDWQVFSVSGLRTFRLAPGKEPELVAEFVTSSDRRMLTAKVGALTLECELPGFPWHSYDFDFASLNVALRFLTKPEGEVDLEIVDPVQDVDPPRLVAKGKVTLAYEADERHGERDCRRYALDGPGLEDRGGTLWVARDEDAHIVAFELDLPDEPGMTSGRLEWLRTETLTSEQWQARLADPDRR